MAVTDWTRRREDVLVIDECKVKVNSGKALLVASDTLLELTGGKRELWFPLSQIDDDSELYGASKPGEVGDLVVSLWIAEQKGIA